MIGVVLWSDPAAYKAVFWCEDQGDLAFYDGSAVSSNLNRFLGVGDMVEFSVKTSNNVRKAYDAYVIEQKVCQGLQEQLRKSAANSSETKFSQVVSFADALEAASDRRCSA